MGGSSPPAPAPAPNPSANYNGPTINMSGPTVTPPPNPPYTPTYGSNTTLPQGSLSGIAGILSQLVNSGAFQNYQTNQYSPSGANNPVNVPYGMQQRSMFTMDNSNPYGGSYGQWSPYGNFYGGFNQYNNGFGGWNPNSTQANTSAGTRSVAPAPNTTGPDALAQLNMMSGQVPPPNA